MRKSIAIRDGDVSPPSARPHDDGAPARASALDDGAPRAVQDNHFAPANTARHRDAVINFFAFNLP